MNEHFSRVVIKPRRNYDDILEEKHKMWYHGEPALNWSHCEQQKYWDEKGQAEISN